MPIRVLIVDDHALLRDALRAALSREPDMRVVAEAADGRTALDACMDARRSVDVVVMDVCMPDLNGVDATRKLRAQSPAARVVALSAVGDVTTVAAMLAAGASAYVLKDAAIDDLARGIRAAYRGELFLGDRVNERALRAAGAGGGTGGVTAREREVWQLVSEGKSTKETAHCLRVSIKTVESHRRNLMEKLGIDSVAELTRHAVRAGITPP